MSLLNRRGIYVSSKVHHAPLWRRLRDSYGFPILSSWISNEPISDGEFSRLWSANIKEASAAALMVFYLRPGETPKGALVELGAALSAGVNVHAVGLHDYTVGKHPLVRHFSTLEEALFGPAADPYYDRRIVEDVPSLRLLLTGK